MILGKGNSRTAATAATIDDLFRRAGVRHPEALALADPPNREDFTGGTPRTLSFAQADRAISALAAKLRGLGLHSDTVVAMQLPNTVESVVAFLGVLRAGMIAAPVPLLWRQQELVAALGRSGAKVILTSSRIGTVAHADAAIRTAVELFPIRHVCGFGRDLPDGVVPLDDVFASESTDLPAVSTRVGPAAAHAAAVTFDVDAHGLVPIARNHVELIAGGLETFLEVGAEAESPLLSTIPAGSFAGIALTVLHWLLSGGPLHLHHGFDPEAFAAQHGSLSGGTVVLPAPALTAMSEAGLLKEPDRTIVALWRAPERIAAAKPRHGEQALVDVACFGETGLVAARRGANGVPAPIPYGFGDASRRAAGAPKVIETGRNQDGMLTLRGRMVPVEAFPPGAARAAPAGFVDTGFACRLDRSIRTLTITAPPSGIAVVGAYRFRQSEVGALVADVDPDATIVALPDSDLGQRLAGSAADKTALWAELQARGLNPLITGAFRPRA